MYKLNQKWIFHKNVETTEKQIKIPKYESSVKDTTDLMGDKIFESAWNFWPRALYIDLIYYYINIIL